MVFVKAKGGPSVAGDPDSKFTVEYYDKEGNLTLRSSGSRAWRCNNPGALLKSPYSIGKDRRSIGTAGYGQYEYAVYPDYQTGHEALVVMLRGSKYSPLTLREASSRYVQEDPNHINKIVKLTKLDPERTIKSLSDDEFEMYWKAIEKNEKWEVGEEDFIEKCYISGVHKKRGVISEYLITGSDKTVWVSKKEALLLASQKRLHATLVHLKSGTVYLRPEYGASAFEVIT